jgi:hypothetical protein
MIQAGKTAATWVTGRVLLFVLALALLVTVDIVQDDGSFIHSRVESLIPDAAHADALEQKRNQALHDVDGLRRMLNARLGTAHELPRNELARWLMQLDAGIRTREAQRLDPFRLMLSAANTDVIVAQARNEAELQVLRWTRQELLVVMQGVASRTLTPEQARTSLRTAAAEHHTRSRAYWKAKRDADAFAAAHPFAAIFPYEQFNIPDADRQRYLKLQSTRRIAGKAVIEANEARKAAEKTYHAVSAARTATARQLENVDSEAFQALDAVIAAKRESAAGVKASLREVRHRIGTLAWTAVWVVVLLTVMPLVLKAFWYFVMAPLAVQRPPIRLAPSSPPLLAPPQSTDSRISSVSHDVQLRAGEELLVHPEFLQSLAHTGDKQTKWLLDSRYPVSSVASGMVVLTRIRGVGQTYTVSSRRDPLAEVGIIDVPDDAQLVLHPRHLVGVVQRIEDPVRITSRWSFGLTAWITLQFRYLLFHGPGQLIVAGCRGIRQESAGSGRNIDQTSTIGFSADLDYVPRRSATFGAYALGINGLFDDGFAGGPGIYVYEEMPYYGKRSGLTGRGLEGVTDLVFRAFGL